MEDKEVIGKLKRVDIRSLWKSESHDFTPWLEENVDALNDILDITISNAEREKSAGPFNVDLVAEDEGGNAVVIEAQLDKSDHDHLGKLLTYSTVLEAKAAIWIVGDPRPEHVSAISWLNECAGASFYLVKIEAVQVGGPPPAPLFTLIVGPSDEAKEIGEKKKGLADRYEIRKRFWAGLLEKAKSKTKLHRNISASKYGYVWASAGMRGLGLVYVIREHISGVELYIDRGKDCERENKEIFDALYKSRGNVEKAFGGQLEWQRLEGRRASRIRCTIEIGGFKDEEKWAEVQDAMVDAMVRLDRALRPCIAKLDQGGKQERRGRAGVAQGGE
ncbi:MAG: DUF4268 domain-containing protein [Planctomycetota bacterium]